MNSRCDAVGVLEAHVVNLAGRTPTFNCTSKGSEKWVPLHRHSDGASVALLRQLAVDYRLCDFTGPAGAC